MSKEGLWKKYKKAILVTCGVAAGILSLGAIGLVCYNYTKNPPSFSNWINKAPLQELESVRDKLQTEYMNPKVSDERKIKIDNLFHIFNEAIENRKWAGQTPVGPAYHREHGWYLPNDD